MLSERTKLVLRMAIEHGQSECEAWREMGPAQLLSEEFLNAIDAIEESGKVVTDNIRANRHEAEQYLAGLLGMF